MFNKYIIMYNQIMYNINKLILNSTATRILNSTIQMGQVSTPKTHSLLPADKQALVILNQHSDKHLQTQEEESVMGGLTRHTVIRQRKSSSLLTRGESGLIVLAILRKLSNRKLSLNDQMITISTYKKKADKVGVIKTPSNLFK
jgi:hypothetical protein